MRGCDAGWRGGLFPTFVIIVIWRVKVIYVGEVVFVCGAVIVLRALLWLTHQPEPSMYAFVRQGLVGLVQILKIELYFGEGRPGDSPWESQLTRQNRLQGQEY